MDLRALWLVRYERAISPDELRVAAVHAMSYSPEIPARIISGLEYEFAPSGAPIDDSPYAGATVGDALAAIDAFLARPGNRGPGLVIDLLYCERRDAEYEATFSPRM